MLDNLHHTSTTYYWDGLQYISFLKNLNIYKRNKIYSHWLSINLILKYAYNHTNIRIPDFKDWTWEEMAHHYSRFKNEIKLN